MAENIIKKINEFNSYKFDKLSNKVINLRTSEDTDIDEFLNIQYLLDCNKIKYFFEKNFEIKVIK